ncbi:family 27 glycoside hydrolase [Geopyxis carbonaria]|nr:family 27 glycoside hydrolase [Geopyxis carbonaria]
MMTRSTTLLLSSFVTTAVGLVAKDGVTGRLPALGWNSWNAYNCNIDEAKILSAAQKLQELGLDTVGYNYVNIDDCWSVKNAREEGTDRLMPNTTKFPNGIDGLADTIHGMGLKIGIYGDAGSATCGGYPGSLYYEDIDAETWAEWGIDYLKYDNCNVPSSWPGDQYHSCHPDYNHPTGPNGTCVNDPGVAPAGYDWTTSQTYKRFNRMTDALQAQDRTILYSLCEWGQAAVETWGNTTAASWRMTDDIFDYWSRITHILNVVQFKLGSVGFWGHNDADMLEVGNGALTPAETRTHFALWAAMKSPLLIGTDLAKLSAANVAILKNPYLLQFNQDPVVGAPATPYKWGTVPNWTYNDTFPAEYWAGDSSQYKKLVLMANFGAQPARRMAWWGEVPGLSARKRYVVVDAWTGRTVGCVRGGWQAVVGSHDVAVGVVVREC